MKDVRVLGLIPARGGSKGVPDKNIKTLGNKPLIGWVAETAGLCNSLTEVILSSDSEKIAEAAKQYGVRSPFKRPLELAQDNTLIVDVLVHALNWMSENEGKEFDYLCLLQPTSPFGLASDYDRAVQLEIEKDADTVISMYSCDQRHPAIMFHSHEDGRAEWFLKDSENRMTRRQDLPPVYLRSGIVYVFRCDMLLKNNALYGERLYAVKVPEIRSLGIDTELDFRYANFLLQEKIIEK